MEDDFHSTYFYHGQSHRCPFGCHEGFFDDSALHRHIQKQLCEQANTLLADIKICKSATIDPEGLLISLVHWIISTTTTTIFSLSVVLYVFVRSATMDLPQRNLSGAVSYLPARSVVYTLLSASLTICPILYLPSYNLDWRGQRRRILTTVPQCKSSLEIEISIWISFASYVLSLPK